MRKFRNIPQKCQLNHSHPSKGEKIRCDVLHLAMKSKDCLYDAIEYEVSYPMMVNGIKICTHKPDFTLHMKDGSIVIDEFKGVRTATFNLKLKLFKALYPKIEYRLTFKN